MTLDDDRSKSEGLVIFLDVRLHFMYVSDDDEIYQRILRTRKSWSDRSKAKWLVIFLFGQVIIVVFRMFQWSDIEQNHRFWTFTSRWLSRDQTVLIRLSTIWLNIYGWFMCRHRLWILEAIIDRDAYMMSFYFPHTDGIRVQHTRYQIERSRCRVSQVWQVRQVQHCHQFVQQCGLTHYWWICPHARAELGGWASSSSNRGPMRTDMCVLIGSPPLLELEAGLSRVHVTLLNWYESFRRTSCRCTGPVRSLT